MPFVHSVYSWGPNAPPVLCFYSRQTPTPGLCAVDELGDLERDSGGAGVCAPGQRV